MNRRMVALVSLALLSSLGACGGGGGSGSGGTNVLDGTNTGGAAAVVKITAYETSGTENASLVYGSDLDLDCSKEWMPQGTLCDEPPSTNSKSLSSKSNSDSGATWHALDQHDTGHATGVLVIDACHDASCSTVSFSEARVFQMFSDGKTTHIRLAVHPETGNTPPAWNNPGWVVVTSGFSTVGAGDTPDGGTTVGSPTVLSLGSQTTRYVRVEVQNDGSLGDDSYIELRSLKLF